MVRMAWRTSSRRTSKCRCSRRCLTRRPAIRNLFPGYLFVRITDGIWYSLTGTRGVLSVLRDGDLPARVRDNEIEYLQQRFGELGNKELHSSRFEPGQSVRVIAGHLRDMLGTFEDLAPGDRVSEADP